MIKHIQTIRWQQPMNCLSVWPFCRFGFRFQPETQEQDFSQRKIKKCLKQFYADVTLFKILTKTWHFYSPYNLRDICPKYPKTTILRKYLLRTFQPLWWCNFTKKIRKIQSPIYYKNKNTCYLMQAGNFDLICLIYWQ